MSKRFGRNQRRALRAQVSALNAAHSKDLSTLAETRQRLQKIEGEMSDWAREILYLMGEDSAFNRKLGALELRRDSAMPNVFEFMPHVRVESVALMSSYSDVPMVSSYDVMRCAVWRLSVDREPFDRKVRITLKRQGSPTTAMVSSDDQLSPRDVQWLGQEIALRFANHINSEKQHDK